MDTVSIFLPRSPWASRTIRRRLVNVAVSRTVLKEATGTSPATRNGAISAGNSTWERKVHTLFGVVSMVIGLLFSARSEPVTGAVGVSGSCGSPS